MRKEIVYTILLSLLVVFPMSVAAGSLSVSINQQRSVMDAGQTNLLTAVISGGNGNYTCDWSYYPFISPSNLASFGTQSCSAVFHGNNSDLASPNVVSVIANDSVGDIGVAQVFVAVKPGLNFLITPSATSVYVGGSVSISNTTANSTVSYTGSPPYAYSFLIPAAGVTENGNSFTFTAPGTYVITEQVTDSNDNAVSASATITVLPPLPPVEVTISPLYSTISAGERVPVTAQASGGTPPYSYVWYVDGVLNSSSSSNIFSFSPVVPSIYSIVATALDANGAMNKSSSILISVTSALTFSSFIANRTTISADQSVLFTNATAGGTGGNQYSYAVSGCTGYVQTGNRFLFTTAGTCTVIEYVTDITGEVSQSIAVQVDVTPPLKTALSANWTTISAGQSVSFINQTTGGTGNNTYAYSFACSGAKQNGNRMTFSSSGSCTVTLDVSDMSGETNQSSVTVSITPPLKFTLFSANWTSVSIGQSVLFINKTSGGTGADQYSYAISGCTGYVQTKNKFLFNTAGTCTVIEYVTDLTGEVNQTQAIQITVTPALAVALTANVTTISAGQSVKFTNSTAGGTGPTRTPMASAAAPESRRRATCSLSQPRAPTQ